MKARKKPAVVDVYKIEDSLFMLGAPRWFTEAYLNNKIFGYIEDFGKGVRIKTLEGIVYAPFGYYVVKDTEGEIYACEPNIFHRNYEISENGDSKKVAVEFKGKWSDEDIHDFFREAAMRTDLADLVEVGDKGLLSLLEKRTVEYQMDMLNS